MKRQVLSLMGAIALSVCACNAGAALLTFTDRAAFLALSGTVTTIDFGGIASSGGIVAFNTSSGLTLSGVNFVGAQNGSPSLYVIDDQFCCGVYSQRGGHVASLTGSEVGNINITLPTGTTAIGMDLFAVTSGDASGVLSDIVHIGIGADTFLVSTVPVGVGNGRVFFGVISDTDISSMSVGPSGVPSTATDIVNFTFGPTPVPAPGAALLLLSALGSFGLKLRRTR